MAQIQMGREEVAQRGKKLYNDNIRALVEIEENIGKMVIIDVESGDYAVDPTGFDAARQLQAKHANPNLYGIRIGYRAAEAIGGAMERTLR